MEMNMVVDRGRSGAERLVENMRQLPPMERLGLRIGDFDVIELSEAIGEMPLGRVALAAAAVSVFAGLAYVARRRLFAAAAVVAEGVEEVADAVEDAAEDVAEAARKRSGAAES